MGHRHPFTAAAQMFEGEDDHTWNHMHMERPYMNLAQNGFFNPIESTIADAVPFSSHWNPTLMSNMYNSLGHNEVSHHQPNPPGPSYNPFVHLPPGGAFCMVPEDYVHHASSSNVDQQTFHGAEDSFVDLTMGNGRVPHKRKSPGIPDTRERCNRNGCYSVGSSSNHHLSSEWQSWTPNLDSQQMPREHISMNPSYRGNGQSIRSDCSMRNVRSRPALDLESNHAGTYLSGIPLPCSYPTNCPNDYSSSSLDFLGETSSTLTQDLRHFRVSSVHGRNLVSDTGGNHETTPSHHGDSASNPSPEIGGFDHDFVLGRHAINSQSFNGALTNSIRGARSSYSQRSSPALRPSSSGLRLGHVAPSDEGLQLFAERYSAGHSRPLPSIPWHGGDRIGRPRASNERYRLLSDEASLRDQLSSEAFMIVERSALYGSRNAFDHRRDMTLDVDNMSYEELLALGERIGTVSTGLSEGAIIKCLAETIHLSSGQFQDRGSCAICLEEYKDMEDVGSLKNCGHDYHAICIKKWLSIKNLCPICKASALDDDSKGKQLKFMS